MSWRVPQGEHERVYETGVFPSLDRVSGTLCLLYYVTETSHLYSLRDFWRHFGLSRAAAHSDCCFFAPCTNILTYLLSGSTMLRFWSWSWSCNLYIGLGLVGLMCCYGPVKLHTCSILIVLNSFSAANSTPLCLPLSVASTQLLITLPNCSAGMQHGLCCHWSLKQCPQCTKWHCRRRQLLWYGLLLLLALWALMALNSMPANTSVRLLLPSFSMHYIVSDARQSPPTVRVNQSSTHTDDLKPVNK